jgi:hypothetical protein
MTTASKTVCFAPFLLWTQNQINGLAREVGEQMFSLLPLCYRIAAALRLTRLLVSHHWLRLASCDTAKRRGKVTARAISGGKRAKESAALSLCICRYGAR